MHLLPAHPFDIHVAKFQLERTILLELMLRFRGITLQPRAAVVAHQLMLDIECLHIAKLKNREPSR